MTAPEILMGLLLKLALGGGFFFALIAFGLWLGRMNFVSDE
jgi:hypothetical protein